MSWGACSPHTKTPTQWRGTMGFKKPTCWHLSTLLSSQTHTHAHTVRTWRRSGEFKSPLPHMYPVWQHFITEVDSTRKSGLTFVRFPQLNAVEMGRNISCRCYDTTTQNSCFGSTLLCGNFRHMCEQTSRTCLWLWRDNASVKTMNLLCSFHYWSQ